MSKNIHIHIHSTTDSDTIKKGDTVKFRRSVDPGDEKSRMIVLEDNGDRVLVKHLGTGMKMEPTAIYRKSELIKT